MKIKKGDKIKVLSGKDRGKSGKVLQVFPADCRASVEGINILIKHLRSNRKGEKGQRIEFPAPLDLSNLALVCPKCGRATRVGFKLAEKENSKGRKEKFRVCKKCGEVIS